MFNRNKFRAKMLEAGVTVESLATTLGVNEATIYRKMSGNSDFLRNEIQLIKHKLSLTDDDVVSIFFAE